MRRVVSLALVLATCATSPAFAGLPGPIAAPASLPPYVPPLTVLDDVLHLPAGEPPQVQTSGVCYGPASHLRLTLALQLAQGLSDERSRVSWLYGWRDAQEAGAVAFDLEHEGRLRAESTATAYEARLQAADQSWLSGWFLGASVVIIFGLGAAAGFAVRGASR